MSSSDVQTSPIRRATSSFALIACNSGSGCRPSGDLGIAKDVGVLSDLLGKRPNAGYPDDPKSLVLQRFPQRAIGPKFGEEPRDVVATLPPACRTFEAQHIELAD